MHNVLVTWTYVFAALSRASLSDRSTGMAMSSSTCQCKFAVR